MPSAQTSHPQVAHNRPGAFAALCTSVEEIKTLIIDRAKDPDERRSQTPPPVPTHDLLQSRKKPSAFSSPPVPDSGWCSVNFLLGAGMVVIQPSTHKIVLLYRAQDGMWFFPRGRKDIGESIEKAALREAYEETGYQVEFLPVYNLTRAPVPPDDPDARCRPNTEAFYLSLGSWGLGSRRKHGGEYLTTWFIGQIPDNAIHTTGTGMENERCFTSHLCTYEEALTRIWGEEKAVLEYAWAVYLYTLNVQGKSL